MFRRFSANFAVISLFFDFLLIDVALFIATDLRMAFGALSFVKEIPEPVFTPPVLYFAFPVLWIGVLLLFSVYDGRKNLRVSDEMGSLTLGSILASIAMAGILYFTYRDVSRFLFLSFVMLGYALIGLWRLSARLAFRYTQNKGMQIRRVLIMGAGEVGRMVADLIDAEPYLGLKLVGFLDDDECKQVDQSKIWGTLDAARKVIAEQQVDDVIIALPLSAHQRLTQVVSDLHDQPVRVRVVPDYFSLTLHRASVEEFASIPMLDLRAPALSEYQRMVKRAFDLVVSMLALPFVLPLMGLIALLIRLDSPGPILYVARRVGENGRLFCMYKFRTMVQDAERLQHLVTTTDENGRLLHKTPEDPRVTRVGRFLRRSSLDELPQILNVLRGEMSLVGPRPELPSLVEQYASWQRKRFVVPQGITGWWQVNGRSDKPMHLHTDEDLYYVQHYSIWLDLHIIAKTIWAVVRGKGAY